MGPGVGDGVGHVVQIHAAVSRRQKKLPVGECQDLVELHSVTDDLDALMACVQLEVGAGTGQRKGAGHHHHYQHTQRHCVLSKVWLATIGYTWKLPDKLEGRPERKSHGGSSDTKRMHRKGST